MRNEAFILYIIFQGPKTHIIEWHISVPIEQPKYDLWNWKTLEVFERY